MPVDKFGGSSGGGTSGGGGQFSTAGLVHKTGDTMLGILSAGGFRVTNVGAPTANTDAATKWYADTIDQDNLQLSGGTMTGDINMGGKLVRGLPTAYPPLYSGNEAISWAQLVGMVTDSTTNNNTVPTGPNYLTNKQYVDAQDALRVLKAGDTMTGDLHLSVGSNTVRLLGCTDLTDGKGFLLALGNIQNQLQFAIVPPGQTQTPVTLETTHGFLVRAAGENVCQLGTADSPPIIIIHKDIAMNSHKIRYLPTPANSDEAATKGYVDGQASIRVLKTGDTMTGALATPQLAIGTSTGGPEIDMLLGGTSSGTALGYGLRIRRTDNLAFCQLAWDAAGFSIYRVDGPTTVAVCTIANGRLTALQNPANAQDAATKNYVDSLSILDYDGHIPPMSANSSQTGFVVSASSFFSSNYQPYMAFAPQIVSSISGNEWATNGSGVGSWIQIQCPAAIRIWKIRLRGRTSNTERITSWNIAGSTGGAFTTLLTSATTLGSTVQEFPVTSNAAFSIYRLNVIAAEPSNPGLSHFQIFSRSI